MSSEDDHRNSVKLEISTLGMTATDDGVTTASAVEISSVYHHTLPPEKAVILERSATDDHHISD